MNNEGKEEIVYSIYDEFDDLEDVFAEDLVQVLDMDRGKIVKMYVKDMKALVERRKKRQRKNELQPRKRNRGMFVEDEDNLEASNDATGASEGPVSFSFEENDDAIIADIIASTGTSKKPQKKEKKKPRKHVKERVIDLFFEQAEDLVEKGKNIRRFRCKLHVDGMRSANGHLHKEFVRCTGNSSSSSNLKSHLASHGDLLKTLDTLGENYSGEELRMKVEALIKSMMASFKNSRLNGRSLYGGNQSEILMMKRMLSALVWFISGNIAFNQFDNPKMLDFVQTVNKGEKMHRRKKAMQLLPYVYDWSLEKGHSVLRELYAFSTTFDMWTSISKQKFLAVTYHGIRKDTFQMENLVLDLIPVDTGTWASVIALLVQNRIDFHTKSCPDLLHASSHSDNGSDAKSCRADDYGRRLARLCEPCHLAHSAGCNWKGCDREC